MYWVLHLFIDRDVRGRMNPTCVKLRTPYTCVCLSFSIDSDIIGSTNFTCVQSCILSNYVCLYRQPYQTYNLFYII